MYTQYVYNAGATQTNITADLLALLTGETDKNNLSASCNKTTTTITVTVAAGWVLHDSDGGSGSKVIKAQLVDDATKFKYVRLYSSATTSIRTEVYETWDAGTNAGTNMCYYSNDPSYSQRLDLTNGGTMHVFSSARFMMLCAETSGGWGTAAYSGPSGCFERTRLLPFDTAAFAMPPFVWIDFGYVGNNSSYSGFAPRIQDRYDTSKTTSNAGVFPSCIGYSNCLSSAPSGVSQKIPNGSGGFVIPFTPIYITSLTSLMPASYGEISSLCDVWKVPDALFTNKDVIQKNAVNYMILKYNTASQFIAVRKG